MLHIPEQQRFAHKCPGGTPRPSLLLQTQRLNENFLLQELGKRKFKSKNAVKSNSKYIKKEQNFTYGFFEL